jgi:hypothetical protein
MYYRALYHTFVAKKKAEVDPFVGTHTDLFLINRSGIRKIADGVVDALQKIYAANLEREKQLPEEAEKQLVEAEKLLFPQPSEPPPKVTRESEGDQPCDLR